MRKYCAHIIVSQFLFIQINVFAQTPILNSYTPAAETVYLVFDGAEVDGTIWNEQGKIVAAPS